MPEMRASSVDVFISYARKESAVAGRLHDRLTEQGWEVWFDAEIYSGARWEALLEETLAAAKAVIVLWSPRSVRSAWVLREARAACRTGKLVPVMIEPCEIPEEFASLQYAQLKNWGDEPHQGFETLLAGLARLAPPSRIDTVRPGFDPVFLGRDVGLPEITGVGDEFRYLHFSVVMNPARRLAWYVAYNMVPRSWDPPREDFWLPDPLLPRAFQPQNEHFAGTGYDRGHLVQSLSVSWGEQWEATIARRQAFYWTNMAPQHPTMNRSWWADLETWEARITVERGQTLGFGGPVLRVDDPLHRDVQVPLGRLVTRQSFRLPRAFWKVVVAPGRRNALELAAFRLDQDALEKGRVGRVDPEQARVSIDAIEQDTGIVFSSVVHEAAKRPLRLGKKSASAPARGSALHG